MKNLPLEMQRSIRDRVESFGDVRTGWKTHYVIVNRTTSLVANFASPDKAAMEAEAERLGSGWEVVTVEAAFDSFGPPWVDLDGQPHFESVTLRVDEHGTRTVAIKRRGQAEEVFTEAQANWLITVGS